MAGQVEAIWYLEVRDIDQKTVHSTKLRLEEAGLKTQYKTIKHPRQGLRLRYGET